VGFVGVGNPPQILPVIFDTGSSVFWVSAVNCSGCAGFFNPIRSSSYRNFAKELQIQFGSGFVFGSVARDRVHLCGASAKTCMTVPQQVFGAIHHHAGGVFNNAAFAGVLGLGLSSKESLGSSLLENLWKGHSNWPQRGVFSFSFSQFPEQSSVFSLGMPSRTRYLGDIAWLNTSTKDHWQVPISDILVDGVSMGVCDGGLCSGAVLDTGSSLVMGPTVAVRRLLRLLKGRKAVVSFKLGHHVFSLQKHDISHRGVPGIFPLDLPAPRGPGLWVLGDLFMRKYHTIFDNGLSSGQGQPRIGLALAKRDG